MFPHSICLSSLFSLLIMIQIPHFHALSRGNCWTAGSTVNNCYLYEPIFMIFEKDHLLQLPVKLKKIEHSYTYLLIRKPEESDPLYIWGLLINISTQLVKKILYFAIFYSNLITPTNLEVKK